MRRVALGGWILCVQVGEERDLEGAAWAWTPEFSGGRCSYDSTPSYLEASVPPEVSPPLISLAPQVPLS